MVEYSVVVPLYNKAPYIKRAVYSVLAQTVQPQEIIVVDDGSTDGGSDEVRKIDDERIHLIVQRNLGVSMARNNGIAVARGELVAFLDADDEWKPEFLATITRLREDHPQCGAYGTAYEIHKPNGSVFLPMFNELSFPMREGIISNYFRAAFTSSLLCSSSVAIPKNVFQHVGGFPEGVVLGEDQDMWVRIALSYPIGFSNSYQVLYHQEAKNRACDLHRHRESVCFADTVAMAIKNGKVPSDRIDDAVDFVAQYQINAASHCVFDGHLSEARAILQVCKGTRRLRARWLWWRAWAGAPELVVRAALQSKGAVRSVVQRVRSLGQVTGKT